MMKNNLVLLGVITVSFFTVLAIVDVNDNLAGRATTATCESLGGTCFQVFAGVQDECSELPYPRSVSIVDGVCGQTTKRTPLPTIATGDAVLYDYMCCAVCGDGRIAASYGEVCDSNNFNGKTCLDYGFNTGNLQCTNQCQIDSSACFNTCVPSREVCDGVDNDCDTAIDEEFVCCGNGVIDTNLGEQCDGDDFAGKTCLDYGYQVGYLFCNSLCLIDSSNCAQCIPSLEVCDGIDNDCDKAVDEDNVCCGNNVINANEQCDGTEFGGAACNNLGFCAGTLACTAACTYDTTGCTPGDAEIGTRCVDGIDNNCDRYIDCNDPSCFSNGYCIRYPRFICILNSGGAGGGCEMLVQVKDPLPAVAAINPNYLGKYIYDTDTKGTLSCDPNFIRNFDRTADERGRCYGSTKDDSPGSLGPVYSVWQNNNGVLPTYFGKGIRYHWVDENDHYNDCGHSCNPVDDQVVGGCNANPDGGGYDRYARSGNYFWTEAGWNQGFDLIFNPGYFEKEPFKWGVTNQGAGTSCGGSPIFSKGGGTTGSPIMWKDIEDPWGLGGNGELPR